MGFFDKLFGRKPLPAPRAASAPKSSEDGDSSLQEPREFTQAVDLQRTYWKHNSEEQAALEARGIEQLSWPERLRLHHLICLERLQNNSDANAEKCQQTLRVLLTPESPYRPRGAMVWQGEFAHPDSTRDPDFQGELLNPSLTHLGCLEIYRTDANFQPTRLDFVGFGELAGIAFAPPNLMRGARLFYANGHAETVMLPLLYGLTWTIGNEFDRDGRMTRFVAHLPMSEEFAVVGGSGMGIGQQDLSVRSDQERSTLFGLGSVAEIAFPLDLRDPDFDSKARARGLDPDEIRRSMEV